MRAMSQDSYISSFEHLSKPKGSKLSPIGPVLSNFKQRVDRQYSYQFEYRWV